MSVLDWTTPELESAAELIALELDKAAPLEPADYEDKYWALRTKLDGTVRLYASRVAAGTWSAWQFRDNMTKSLRKAYTEAYRFGVFSIAGRTVLSEADRATIADAFGDDLNYLDRFAALIPASQWSEAYLTDRAAKYANSLHGVFWAGRVSRYEPEQLLRWLAVDDPATCKACESLNQHLFTVEGLPGLPGDMCAGGGNCRCQLEPVDRASLSAPELLDVDQANY